MAESAVSFLFNQLSSWLHQEAQLLGRLRDEVEWIQNEMGQMRAFLRIADAKEDANPILSEWVRQVREVAYDTEDIIEEFMLRFGHESEHGFIGSMKKIYYSVKHLCARHRLASDIIKIRSRVEAASQSKQRFTDVYGLMLQGGSSSTTTLVGGTSYDGRGDALFLEEAEVVGTEKPKKQLVEWLSSRNGGLKVISVVGMAGLGKTTLVKKVYDDASVKSTFDYHVWITVSESFNINHLLKDMIKQLVSKAKQPPPLGFETMNNDATREFIYNFLQTKSYIIVLDDIWRIDAWEPLKYAFPRSNTTGQGYIIITTRFNNIGNVAFTETNGHFYSLKPLSPEDSEVLFNKKAFPRDQLCPANLKEISKNILRRCEGVPLAIVVIGGLLATKNNRIEEWEMFNRSLGVELERDSLKRMNKLIALSYYDLPYYLKACFLYLSIFSEDELIHSDMLIQMWMSEGFVEKRERNTKEEVAEGYLNELVNRSLIQVMKTDSDGTTHQLHVHDLVREYIIKKARGENFITVDNHGGIRWSDKIRRLALHSPINHLNQLSDSKFKSLRSLIIFGSSSTNDDVSGLILYKVLPRGCTMLKVLKLARAPLDTVPDEVYKLYHLEYLSLEDTQVHHISKSIGNLRKLETLDLEESMVCELPIEILQLQRLRNILVYKNNGELGGYHQFEFVQSFKAPYEIGKLSCLRNLFCIEAGCGKGGIRIVKEIGKLTQLHGLGISKLRREDGEELSSSLAKLTNLRKILIISIEEDEVIDLQYALCNSDPHNNNTTALPFLHYLSLSGRLECMPPWISSLNNLTELYLRWSRLREDDRVLECLQGLPNLVLLGMDCAYEGEGLSFREGGFPKLKELGLIRLRGLRWVRVEKGSIPHLGELIIENCKMMKEVPTGIEHLRNLSLVEFADMSDEFLKRLSDERRQKLGELSHVPKVRAFNWVEGIGWKEWKL